MKLITATLALFSWGVVPGLVQPQAQDAVASDTPAPQSAIDNPQSVIAPPLEHREVPDDPYMATPPQPLSVALTYYFTGLYWQKKPAQNLGSF